MNTLLTRDQFREGVFARDGYKCVICGEPSVDAHHIIERRLFDDGGYYLDNGASLCEEHHIEAEQTKLSCEDIRTAAGITNIILPYHLYDDNDYTYDKWGNIIMPNGTRLKGELFNDVSVQKILTSGGVLNEFVPYIKYPRTHHLPFSEKMTKDDRVLKDTSIFEGKEVVVTRKMDGENTNMYKDYIHARSINSGSHPTRGYVKSIWSSIAHDIPDGWRLCGENMYGVHTISYVNLPSYFLLFSIWDDKNVCLSWDETLEYAELFGLHTVPVLYSGVYDEALIKSLHTPFDQHGNRCEGYVVRLAEEYHYKDFKKSVAKFVSADFQIKHGHWTSGVIQSNTLIQ